MSGRQLTSLAWALAFACSEPPPPRGETSTLIVGEDAAFAGAACVEGATTCAGSTYSHCQAGVFVELAQCSESETCVPGQGCVLCNIGDVVVCDGAALYACAEGGARGEKVRDCEDGCENGRCLTACAPGTELIYVVDVDDTLLSFDPRTLEFTEIGTLDCPAGDAWSEFGDGPATPFSMAVDRSARAWLLYSSGEVFWVDTATARCELSPYPFGSAGFHLFGMAFVAEGEGAETEALHIAGPVGEDTAKLGTIDAAASGATVIGDLPERQYGAELTGNGNGELWAYWPGMESAVARVDKTTAGVEQEWPLPSLENPPAGWAFAHWGGQYYVFISEQLEGQIGRVTISSRVLRFDPATGETTVPVEDASRRIVGAGVSTCAPVINNF